jgi:glycosyltransferase involved in cell wall biosynthesis
MQELFYDYIVVQSMQSQMKILYLTDNLNHQNGWGRYASDLISSVENLGHKTVVLTASRKLGATVISKIINAFALAVRVRKYSAKCDIIHALDAYPFGIIAAIANIGRKNKLVITGQGTYAISAFYGHHFAWLLRWAYKKADGVIAISEYTKQRILENVDLAEVNVIEHGIDINKFSRARVSSPGKYIISVGALKSRKGYHVSIPAFALAKKKMPDLKYKIVGNQSDVRYFNDLKKIVVDYNIEKDVEFITGISDDELGSLYAGARLFILTSINDGNNFEGFGLVFLEAAAAGLPVVGTRDNGISSAIKENCNGLLVRQEDIEETSDAILKLLVNNDLDKKFSSYSYDWAGEHTLEIMANRYSDFYRFILSGK